MKRINIPKAVITASSAPTIPEYPHLKCPPLTSFPTITTEMVEQFEILTDYVRPAEFRNQLVNLYLQFVMCDPEGFPEGFKHTTDNLYIFLEFLTNIQEAIDDRNQ